MELIDLYDKNKMFTGKTIERGDPVPLEHYHLVIHVCIFNTKGEMLIQQRQPFKTDWPNLWDITVAGCAATGEKSQEAAMREVYEELGYKIDLRGQRPALTVNFDHGFDDIYLLESDIEIIDLTLQASEVQKVQWASKDEILSLISKKEFIPYHKSLIELLFVMRSYKGVHTRL